MCKTLPSPVIFGKRNFGAESSKQRHMAGRKKKCPLKSWKDRNRMYGRQETGKVILGRSFQELPKRKQECEDIRYSIDFFAGAC